MADRDYRMRRIYRVYEHGADDLSVVQTDQRIPPEEDGESARGVRR